MRGLDHLYSDCHLCPKNCHVNRLGGEQGFCGMPGTAVAASAVLHRGEEPPLTGGKGSGAVFFTGCTLGCPFCQNEQISDGKIGTAVGAEKLAEIFIELQNRGASNINLVTASQYIPSIIEAAGIAAGAGLTLPFLWNSSGYETAEAVDMLGDTVDVWLPDVKTLDTALAGRLFSAPDYPEYAAAVAEKMADNVEKGGGFLVEDGRMKRGIIIRHLIMPGELDSTYEVLRWFAERLKERALLSLMVQYTPVNAAGREIAGPGYMMPETEYDLLLKWLDELEIEDGFLQEPEAAALEWVPDFTGLNPFPADYSDPVWHYTCGFLQ